MADAPTPPAEEGEDEGPEVFYPEDAPVPDLPRPGRRRRKRVRKGSEKEEEEELSEGAVYAEMLSKGERSDGIIKLVIQFLRRSTSTNEVLTRDQRQYIYAMMAREEKQGNFIDKLEAKNLELIDKVAELNIKLAEASSSSSKWKEVAEIGVLLLGTEIGMALTSLATNQLKKLTDEDRKKIVAERDALKKQLEAKEKGEIKKA